MGFNQVSGLVTILSFAFSVSGCAEDSRTSNDIASGWSLTATTLTPAGGWNVDAFAFTSVGNNGEQVLSLEGERLNGGIYWTARLRNFDSPIELWSLPLSLPSLPDGYVSSKESDTHLVGSGLKVFNLSSAGLRSEFEYTVDTSQPNYFRTELEGLVVSNDGRTAAFGFRQIASNSNWRRTYIMDTTTGAIIREFANFSPMAITPDGRFTVLGNGSFSVRIANNATGQVLAMGPISHLHQDGWIDFSNDARVFAVKPNGTSLVHIYVWNLVLAEYERVHTVNNASNYLGIARRIKLSGDGSRLVVAGYEQEFVTVGPATYMNRDMFIAIYDTATGDRIGVDRFDSYANALLPYYANDVVDLDINDDGTRAVLATYGDNPAFQDIQGGAAPEIIVYDRTLGRIDFDQQGSAKSAKLSPSGDRLVMSYRDIHEVGSSGQPLVGTIEAIDLP